MKHILYLFITTIALLSCNGQDDKIAAFHSQKHRFEVRGCEFFYNDQKIELYTPKSNFIKLFGDDFRNGAPSYHKKVPIIISEQVRSWEQSDILDVYHIVIKFWDVTSEHKNYDNYKGLPTMKKGMYILIDGVPFGHDISIVELNKNLEEQEKQGFSGSFAGSSGIKGRGHLECENFPQFFISYDEEGKLQKFSFTQQNKPKRLK